MISLPTLYDLYDRLTVVATDQADYITSLQGWISAYNDQAKSIQILLTSSQAELATIQGEITEVLAEIALDGGEPPK